jgi:hypothetical protein
VCVCVCVCVCVGGGGGGGGGGPQNTGLPSHHGVIRITPHCQIKRPDAKPPSHHGVFLVNTYTAWQPRGRQSFFLSSAETKRIAISAAVAFIK